MTSLRLPVEGGLLEAFRLSPPSSFPLHNHTPFPRVAYAAAHVVADPLRSPDPFRHSAIDWEATLAFRRHLWGLGFKIAEAMDTSQRGTGLDWPSARELITRSLNEARSLPGADLACGAGTDQLAPDQANTLEDVIHAYEEQLAHIELHGGRAILMASRALAWLARSPDDYGRVYDRILSQAREPVVLHWLGEMFDSALAGYWGADGFEQAMQVTLDIISRNLARVDGIKISLLDAEKEVRMRARLPAGVKMFTGDDFNYAGLIAGDGRHYSHALLGILDPIAPAAAAAFLKLGAGDRAGYDAILHPTIALSRKIFESPTPYYKAGVVFLAWLNGFQAHFVMVGAMQSARSILHYAELFRLADRASLFADPERAAQRMRALLAVHGVAG